MICIYSLLVVGFLALFLFTPDITRLANESLSLEVRAEAAEKMLTLHSRIWPTVLLVVLVTGILSFRAFSRFSGPLDRFRWAFDQVANGNLGFHLQLRKKDYLHEEKDALNLMIDELKGKIAGMESLTMKAFNSMDDLEQSLSGGRNWGDPEKKMLDKHRQNLNRLKEAVQSFTISPNGDQS
jgi:hypothetical protein